MSDFTPQQSAAIRKCGNLLVVAGAGTGKTHTLIARCLRLITEERASLENVLMVTFTEAAAADMRARLREKLHDLAAVRTADEHLAQQLALLDPARISTLHSFCLQLARGHFHALGLDPQFGVLDESQTRPLQREALDETLERHYAGSDDAARAVQSLIRTLGRGDDEKIRSLVLKLHAYAQSLPDPEGWIAAQEKFYSEAEPSAWEELLVRAVADWRDEWLEELQDAPGDVKAVELSLASLETLPENPTLAEADTALQTVLEVDADDDNWPKGSVGKVRNFIKGFFDTAEFLGVLAADSALQQDWDWARAQMLALLGLVRGFAVEFAAKKRELGGVDFTDLEQCALKLLRDERIVAGWRARLAHIFVDEYQDINAAQDAILTALGRDGADANRFLVGDVKQSIYRFRRANPKIFAGYSARWAQEGADGQRIPLTENFRSRAALLEFVNALFTPLMREELGGVGYEPLQFGAPGKPDATPAVELHLIAKPDEESGEETGEADADTEGKTETPDLLAVEREARLVAKRLRELKFGKTPADKPFQIWDKDKKIIRDVEWRDMAVLLRSPRGRAEAFAMEFSRAGVPLSAARDGFFASLEVSDLLSLLKLLDNPLQDVPLLAVLRSPLVGLSLEELAMIRAASDARPFWTALAGWQKAEGRRQNELAAKVETFLEQFARWRELVRQTSLSQTLETALSQTHYESLLLAEERGAERAANVRKLLDLARQFDPYQRQGLYRFLRHVRLQEDEELDLEPASPPVENAVRLVSIHKSKGLEFPIVALAGMGTRFNEQDLNAAVLLHETLGLCPKIFPPDAEQSYPGLTHWLARRAEKNELRGEELRLLYVALTRARDRLVLVGTTGRKADAARWVSSPDMDITTGLALAARSHLDWLTAWLPTATRDVDWRDQRSGANGLLTWQIVDGDDAMFADQEKNSVEAETKTAVSDAAALAALRKRLDWQYPFAAATVETAKTSVSVLRRRLRDETDDEAHWRFQIPNSEFRIKRGRLSAAEVGTAHHAFMQLVSPNRTATEKDLRDEAARMQATGALAAEEVAALDFAALAGFWSSPVGVRLRGLPEKVLHREMPFTARMSAADLRSLNLPPANPALGGDEFVVVQGVVDLAVILPEEIWLLDFKTDAVKPGGLEEKVEFYSPQLKLYALALGRIYRRPVTQSWLHFLACGETVSI